MRKVGFSVAETLIALLIISVMMAVAAPIVVKKIAQGSHSTQNQGWVVDKESNLVPLYPINYGTHTVSAQSFNIKSDCEGNTECVVVDIKTSNNIPIKILKYEDKWYCISSECTNNE